MSVAGILIIFAVLTVVVVLQAFLRHRQLFHPRVAFPLVYLWCGGGTAFAHITGLREPYWALIEENLPLAMWACVLAQLGFVFGSLFAESWIYPKRGFRTIYLPQVDLRRVRLACQVACSVVLAALALTLMMRFEQLVTYGKTNPTNLGLDTYWFRISRRVLMLLHICLPMYICLIQWEKRKILPAPLLVLLCVDYVVLAALLERDFFLHGVMLLAAWSMHSRLRMSWLCAIGAVLGTTMLALPVVRTGGISSEAMIDNLSRSGGPREWAGRVLTQGGNVWILTNVIDWFPDKFPFRHGSTFVMSMLNLKPSFLSGYFGQPLIYWYKQELNPTSLAGYGFALDAEGYMNFGIVGPALVYFVVGVLLTRLYCLAKAGSENVVARAHYVFFLPFAMYCIRGDSLMLLKGYTVFALMAWFWVLLAAPSRARVRRYGGSVSLVKANKGRQPAAPQAEQPGVA